MSIKVMARIWEEGPKSQSERFVLLALADYANDAGECWPSIAGICQKVCMSDRGIQKIIRRLEVEGWLEIETGNGRHGCNKYTIKTPNTVHPEPRSPRTPVQKTPNASAENPEHGSPEPSLTIKEPSEEEPPMGPPSDKPPPKARLPGDWTLSEAGWAYARSQKIPDQIIEDEARGFHAYWTDRTDKDARKSRRGWEQCWAGWCRRIAPRYARHGFSPRPENRPDPALEQIARLAGLGQASGHGGR